MSRWRVISVRESLSTAAYGGQPQFTVRVVRRRSLIDLLLGERPRAIEYTGQPGSWYNLEMRLYTCSKSKIRAMDRAVREFNERNIERRKDI